jgi:hypothetical protein
VPVIDPSTDARQERRTGSPEGLARRIAELERRVSRYESGLYVPFFNASGSGGFSTAAPPNSTSGNAFNIGVPGTYLISCDVTAWATAVGMIYVGLHIDGGGESTNCEKYCNEANSHQVLHSRWFGYNFTTTGTHYLWHRQVGAIGSDGNDRWSMVGFRVGALP